MIFHACFFVVKFKKEKMMKRGFKRGLSLLVLVMMLLSMVPIGIVAEEISPEEKALTGIPNHLVTPLTIDLTEQGLLQNPEISEEIRASATEGDFQYKIVEGGVSITRYIGLGGDLVIPDSLGGKKVVAIGLIAFQNCSGLTSVRIPNSVIEIGGHAFRYCSGLSSFTIPNSVTSIGYAALSDCTGLKSITIPNNVTTIGDFAFAGCTELTSIKIPNTVTTIGVGVFQHCSKLTSVELPNTITAIGNCAFQNCIGLRSIRIPDAVVSIDNYGFYGCSGLTSVELPDNMTTIGYSAFWQCTGLTSIKIPNSVTSIGHGAFSECRELTIYGVKGSYAETYANKWNIPFEEIKPSVATLKSIAISKPANKLIYQVGEPLDITGLEVTGTYSDGSTKKETVTVQNITGFNSSKANPNQLLTIMISERSTTYRVQITDQIIDQICEVSINDITIEEGEKGTLDASITPNAEFNAMQLVFTFNPAKLEYIESDNSNDLKGTDLKAFEALKGSGLIALNANDAVAGEVSIAYITTTPFDAGGKILKLSFKAKAEMIGMTPVNIQVKELVKDNNGTGVSIPTTIKAGSVKIIAANEDAELAKAVSDQIKALPLVDQLKLTDEAAVVEARLAYEKLTEAQKELVENLNTLIAAEVKLVELKETKVTASVVEINQVLGVRTYKITLSGAEFTDIDDILMTTAIVTEKVQIPQLVGTEILFNCSDGEVTKIKIRLKDGRMIIAKIAEREADEAKEFDLIHKTDPTNLNYSFIEYVNRPAIFIFVNSHQTDYLFVGEGLKRYEFSEVIMEYEANPGNIFDVLKRLDPVTALTK